MSWVPDCRFGSHEWDEPQVVKMKVQRDGFFVTETSEIIGFKQTCKHCGVLFVNELGR